ncbi:retrotransposon protein, putative, ty1-copia subclass [Tanacetum coccineum]
MDNFITARPGVAVLVVALVFKGVVLRILGRTLSLCGTFKVDRRRTNGESYNGENPGNEAIHSSIKDEWVCCYGERDEALLKMNHTVILILAACEDYELEQLDVKKAFLYGNLEETIYMRQPLGFEEGTCNKVCLLKQSLYSHKQSSRQWYNGLLGILTEIQYTKGLLRKEFDMKKLGPARKILGMKNVKDRGSQTLKVSQSGYVQNIMNNFRVNNDKLVSVPLGAHFKDDVRFSVSMYLANSDQAKHVDVDSFVDADYDKDPDKDRSIIGYLFMVYGYVASWKATLQHLVTLSTTEAEYMAQSICCYIIYYN